MCPCFCVFVLISSTWFNWSNRTSVIWVVSGPNRGATFSSPAPRYSSTFIRCVCLLSEWSFRKVPTAALLCRSLCRPRLAQQPNCTLQNEGRGWGGVSLHWKRERQLLFWNTLSKGGLLKGRGLICSAVAPPHTGSVGMLCDNDVRRCICALFLENALAFWCHKTSCDAPRGKDEATRSCSVHMT